MPSTKRILPLILALHLWVTSCPTSLPQDSRVWTRGPEHSLDWTAMPLSLMVESQWKKDYMGLNDL